MSWARHLSFKYHTQDLSNYCGAAVTSMILLANNKVPLLFDQENIWSVIQNNNLKNLPRTWATEPQGLATTLTQMSLGLGNPANYVVYQPTNQQQGSVHILNSLYQFNNPAAALVYRSAHWIAVNGVQTDREPVAGANWQIEGFWVQTPIFHSPQNPPPHSNTDPCGNGNAMGDDDQFWVYTNDEWLGYFRGCRYDNADVKFISVSPVSVPAAVADIIETSEAQLTPPPVPTEKPPTLDGYNLISPAQAIEFSQRGLRQYNLYQYDFVNRGLRNAAPGRPLLVNESDRLNTYYYLVPWEIDRAVIVYTKVDARFGAFRGLQLLNKPLPNAVISKERALKLVLGKRFEFPNVVGRIMLFPGTAAVLPTLVWRPCLESMSSYLPFYQVAVDSHVVYVRVDGEVFTKLTPAANGGYPDDENARLQ